MHTKENYEEGCEGKAAVLKSSIKGYKKQLLFFTAHRIQEAHETKRCKNLAKKKTEVL